MLLQMATCPITEAAALYMLPDHMCYSQRSKEFFDFIYVWGASVALQLLDAHLGTGTGRRTATMVAPLLLTSGPVRYEAVLVGAEVPTCDSAHSWCLYSVVSLEHQATGIMTCYPTP